MNFHGQQMIGASLSADSADTFTGIDPRDGSSLPGTFHEATDEEIDRAVSLASDSFDAFRRTSRADRARLLRAIADEAENHGEELMARASAETGHPPERCLAERNRSVHQARLFASVIEEGSWVDARIDLPLPDRQPIPRPDIRSLMQPIGPVAVFGASNFPIAISVLGSDTVSALGAGCPLIIKAHPAHPGACEAAAAIVRAAIAKSGLPDGIFSLVHGRTSRVGMSLVQHPALTGAAFTGSLAGGRALFDAAQRRSVPIPFFAEMGSVNPLFILPGALAEGSGDLARGFVTALTMGVGQFCTNPGLVFGPAESPHWDEFRGAASGFAAEYDPQPMLHAGIHHAYEEGIAALRGRNGLTEIGRSARAPESARAEAACYLFETDAPGFRANPELFDEVFGPVSTLVSCRGAEEFEEFAARMEGSLTATIHGTEADLEEHGGLIARLEKRVGRLIFNGYPVGLDVCHAIHHGGPYPATAHSHFTSIGTRAIQRFVRPLCYQNWPDAALPPELRNANPGGLLRLVDGHPTRDAISG